MARVSIIIVNWNGKALLADCIGSILCQTYTDYEIILVDNGSTDESAEFVADAFPLVKVVGLMNNSGFTGGNIEGLKYAQGELIVLLNNDALLSEIWLSVMVAAMDSDERVGTCSSKIILFGTHLIDSVGNLFTTAGSGVKRGELEDADTYASNAETWGACAAAAIYRKLMFDEIGFLDEDFFLNYEDTDLDFRAMLAGWKSIFVHDAVVYHKVSSTIGSFSDVAVYYFARNSLLVWLKNMPFGLMVRYFHHRIFFELASFVYYGIINRKLLPYIKGKCSAISLMTKMLRKRRIIQGNRKVSTSYLQSVFVPIHTNVLQRVRVLVPTKRNGHV